MKLLERLGVASLLTSAWLAHRLRATRAMLRQHFHDEAALREIARALGGAETTRAVLQQVTDAGVAVTGATSGYVERVGPTGPGGDVEVAAVSGQGTPPLGTRVPYPGSLTEAIIQSGEPGLVTEVGGIGERMAMYLAECCRGYSALVVPVLADDRALGALVLLRAPDRPPFTTAEVRLARTLGDAASAALRRALLGDEIERERSAREALLQSTDQGIFGVDLDGRCTFLNRASAELTGYSPAEMRGQNLHTRIHHTRPDGQPYPAPECPIIRTLKTGRTQRVDDEVFWRKDGTSFAVEYSVAPIRENGRVTGAVVAFTDITERRASYRMRERLLARERDARGEAERRAREESALRRAAAAVSASFTEEEVIHRIADSAVTATSADGAYVERINDQHTELEVVAVAGSRVPPVGSRIPYARSYAERVVQHAESETIPRLDSADLRLPDEVVRACPDCAALVIPLINAGEPVGTLTLLRSADRHGFRRDEAHRAETFAHLAALALRRIHMLRESEARRHELERVMESRARLVRGFSHDVKNPLGAANGFLQLLGEGAAGPLNEQQRANVDRAQRAIENALALIDDLLRVARAETEHVEIAWTAVDVREAVRELAEEYRAQAQAKGLDMTVDLPEALPLIESDASRIRQILGNLLSNAVKYTERGSIAVRVGTRHDGGAPAPGDWICITVSDTGPGIPAEDRDLLFQEFPRLEPGVEHGAGLGLAISRRIADAIGGEITFQSEVGAGSTFTLWLPLDRETGGQAD
ncbi:MAG TPA: ATP-binding protein [Longimicrobiales bacterium]